MDLGAMRSAGEQVPLVWCILLKGKPTSNARCRDLGASEMSREGEAKRVELRSGFRRPLSGGEECNPVAELAVGTGGAQQQSVTPAGSTFFRPEAGDEPLHQAAFEKRDQLSAAPKITANRGGAVHLSSWCTSPNHPYPSSVSAREEGHAPQLIAWFLARLALGFTFTSSADVRSPRACVHAVEARLVGTVGLLTCEGDFGAGSESRGRTRAEGLPRCVEAELVTVRRRERRGINTREGNAGAEL